MHINVKLLILGALVVLAAITAVIVSLYLPTTSVHSNYDFLYVSGEDFHGEQFTVESGKLKQITQPKALNPAKLYIYQSANNKSQETTFEQASNLKLLDSVKSPDDFTFTRGQDVVKLAPSSAQTGPEANAVYLAKGDKSFKLNLTYSENAYYNNFRLLGWIEK